MAGLAHEGAWQFDANADSMDQPPEVRCGGRFIAECVDGGDAAYIAAVSPDVVLALLSERDALNRTLRDAIDGLPRKIPRPLTERPSNGR